MSIWSRPRSYSRRSIFWNSGKSRERSLPDSHRPALRLRLCDEIYSRRNSAARAHLDPVAQIQIAPSHNQTGGDRRPVRDRHDVQWMVKDWIIALSRSYRSFRRVAFCESVRARRNHRRMGGRFRRYRCPTDGRAARSHHSRRPYRRASSGRCSARPAGASGAKISRRPTIADVRLHHADTVFRQRRHRS